jgi:hypothetical protein
VLTLIRPSNIKSYWCGLYLNQPGSCQQGDLIGTNVEKALFVTCDPINDKFLSSVVDVPNVDRHRVDYVPVSGLPVLCGTADTRCVGDKAVDLIKPTEGDTY